MPYSDKKDQRRKESQQRYVEKNRATINAKKKIYWKEYYKKNQKKLKEKSKIYGSNSIVKNRNKERNKSPERKISLSESSRRYRANNKEKVAYRAKKYRILNREKINIYKKMKYKTDLNYKLAEIIRNRLHKAIKRKMKKGSTIHLIGCSFEYLIKWIESQFLEGMNWENWGNRGWHIDHIKPLSSFDLTENSQLLRASHYTNLQPLWWEANIKKGNKI